MTFSSLANMDWDIPAGDRYSVRNSAINGVIIHHNAGVDAYGQATAPGREVSANYWISDGGVIIPNVDEEYRAFTSGHPSFPAGAAADHRSITFEVSNSRQGVADGSWAISGAAFNSLAMLIGDIFKRYNLGPVRRGTNGGVAVHRDFVSTECPGPYIMNNLDRLIALAEQYRTGQSTSNPGVPVKKKWKSGPVVAYDPKEGAEQVLKGAVKDFQIVKINAKGDTTIASGAALHEVKGQINVSGTPGDQVELALGIDLCEKDGKRVAGQVTTFIAAETAVLGKKGSAKVRINEATTLTNAEKAGQSYRVRLYARPLDGNDLKVTFVRSTDLKL